MKIKKRNLVRLAEAEKKWKNSFRKRVKAIKWLFSLAKEKCLPTPKTKE